MQLKDEILSQLTPLLQQTQLGDTQQRGAAKGKARYQQHRRAASLDPALSTGAECVVAGGGGSGGARRARRVRPRPQSQPDRSFNGENDGEGGEEEESGYNGNVASGDEDDEGRFGSSNSGGGGGGTGSADWGVVIRQTVEATDTARYVSILDTTSRSKPRPRLDGTTSSGAGARRQVAARFASNPLAQRPTGPASPSAKSPSGSRRRPEGWLSKAEGMDRVSSELGLGPHHHHRHQHLSPGAAGAGAEDSGSSSSSSSDDEDDSDEEKEKYGYKNALWLAKSRDLLDAVKDDGVMRAAYDETGRPVELTPRSLAREAQAADLRSAAQHPSRQYQTQQPQSQAHSQGQLAVARGQAQSATGGKPPRGVRGRVRGKKAGTRRGVRFRGGAGGAAASANDEGGENNGGGGDDDDDYDDDEEGDLEGSTRKAPVPAAAQEMAWENEIARNILNLCVMWPHPPTSVHFKKQGTDIARVYYCLNSPLCCDIRKHLRRALKRQKGTRRRCSSRTASSRPSRSASTRTARAASPLGRSPPQRQWRTMTRTRAAAAAVAAFFRRPHPLPTACTGQGQPRSPPLRRRRARWWHRTHRQLRARTQPRPAPTAEAAAVAAAVAAAAVLVARPMARVLRARREARPGASAICPRPRSRSRW